VTAFFTDDIRFLAPVGSLDGATVNDDLSVTLVIMAGGINIYSPLLISVIRISTYCHLQ